MVAFSVAKLKDRSTESSAVAGNHTTLSWIILHTSLRQSVQFSLSLPPPIQLFHFDIYDHSASSIRRKECYVLSFWRHIR